MPRKLTITPKPYKSSNLAVPPSPFSPQLPITPPPWASNTTCEHRPKPIWRPDYSPPPANPLHWLWQCHLCNRCYQLGVTRRCLDDGHYFCAGTTTVKRNKRSGAKKIVRHKACASEFDYQGWKAWGDWRRDVLEQAEAAAALELLLEGDGLPLFAPTVPGESQRLGGACTKKASAKNPVNGYWSKDCFNVCDFPSECRWGNQFSVITPATVIVPSFAPPTLPVEPQVMASKSSKDSALSSTTAGPATEGYVEPASRTPFASPEEETKPSMDELLESAKRRKRRSTGHSPSPLALNPTSRTGADSEPTSSQTLQKALDDFELDFKKSFGRASELVSNFVNNRRSSSAGSDTDESKGEGKGHKLDKKRHGTGN